MCRYIAGIENMLFKRKAKTTNQLQVLGLILPFATTKHWKVRTIWWRRSERRVETLAMPASVAFVAQQVVSLRAATLFADLAFQTAPRL